MEQRDNRCQKATRSHVHGVPLESFGPGRRKCVGESSSWPESSETWKMRLAEGAMSTPASSSSNNDICVTNSIIVVHPGGNNGHLDRPVADSPEGVESYYNLSCASSSGISSIRSADNEAIRRKMCASRQSRERKRRRRPGDKMAWAINCSFVRWFSRSASFCGQIGRAFWRPPNCEEDRRTT